MTFQLNGKIAIVTGGISGIGLEFVKEFLRHGVRGVTIVDINSNLAHTVLKEIEKEFGPNRILFVKADVSDMGQFEDAFKKTIETFKHVDILINNAGIFDDKMWQREIAINMNGMINGMILGMEKYLSKYKQGSEAVIVNNSSISSISVIPCLPIYSGIKAALVQMTRVWGDPYHYQRTKVRVFAICPGVTETPLVNDGVGNALADAYADWFKSNFSALPRQEADYVAQEGTKLINSCPSGSIWVIEKSEPAYQYVFVEREALKK